MIKREVKSLALIYLDRVVQLYGYSKHQISKPYLVLESSVYADGTDKNLKGEFDSDLNEIIIYWKNISSKEELVRTIIHEYQHYLQSPSWMTRYYNMGYTYENHPYEIAAYAMEENYKSII